MYPEENDLNSVRNRVMGWTQFTKMDTKPTVLQPTLTEVDLLW